MQTDIINSERYRFLQRLLRHFCSVYFFIYIFPFPLYYVPLINIISTGYFHLLHILVVWTGTHVFHVALPARPRGDVSDGVYQYVQFFVLIILTILLSSAWCLSKKIKKYNGAILYWMSVYIRYRFAISMLKYGFEKIQKVQFPFPYNSLTETYGESSPMRLMWSFMGYSTPYNIFIGVLEAGAGCLLLFRKTKLLGTLVSVAVLSNVAILNFCYDVPVKMHSLMLLLMAVFIAAPDVKRLYHFLLNKALPPADKDRYANRWTTMLFSILNIGIFAITFYIKAGPVWRQHEVPNTNAAIQKTPLSGIYTIEQFVKKADTLSAKRDSEQWKILSLIRPGQAMIKMTDNTFHTYRIRVDTTLKTMQLSEPRNTTAMANLTYELLPDSTQIIAVGKLDNQEIYILMQKQDMKRYELLNRSFHWVNEYPYNK